MSLLTRYTLRELIVPFLIGTFAVVLMFQANLLIAEFKTISVQHVPFIAILQMVLYKTPNYLSLTMPVGVSLAASLAFSRLSRESELTAMRGAGAPILKVVMPVAWFGLAAGVANFINVEQVMPRAEREFRRLAMQVGTLSAAPDFASNTIVKLSNATVFIGTVTRGKDGSVQLTDVQMVERPRPHESWLFTADEGSYKEGVWTLKNALWRVFEGDHLLVMKSERKDVSINERIVLRDLFAPPQPEEQTAAQLAQAIRDARKVGTNTTSLEVSYHARFAVPAACLVFAFVSPMFAVIFARSGSLVGVLLSIVVVFLYYNAFVITTEILGRTGYLPPVVAAWAPNILFVALGFLALRRLE